MGQVQEPLQMPAVLLVCQKGSRFDLHIIHARCAAVSGLFDGSFATAAQGELGW
jgi:hypothetical protein